MRAEQQPPSDDLAGRKEWAALTVLLLPLLLVSMDISVLYFAVPFISQDLQPSATQQLWIFDIYGFVLAGLLLTMGSLGDRIGRRKLLLIGAVGFSIGSLAAAYSQSTEMLIAARALLGIAGATLMPSTLALIRNLFHDSRQRSKAIAIWSAVMTGGIAVGPVLSGFLLEHFWWGSVFLINIPAMALLLILGPMLLPEFKEANPGRFDLISAALSLASILPVIFGIKEWAAQGFSPEYLVCIGSGVAVGVVFVIRQRRIADPMLDVSLFSGRHFSGALIANTVAIFALVGNAVFLTQYLQSVLGYPPFVAAMWSLLPSVFVGGAAVLAGAMGRKFDRAFVMGGGFITAAIGFAILTQTTALSSVAVILIGATVLSIGLVTVITLVTEIAMGAIEPARAGSASAVVETSSEFGGALGIAILGSVGAAIYADRMLQAIPAGLSVDAEAAARETLAGATVVAAQLPTDIGAVLLADARDAFTSGMHGVSVVGAVMMLGAALLCVTALRGSTVPAPTAEVPVG